MLRSAVGFIFVLALVHGQDPSVPCQYTLPIFGTKIASCQNGWQTCPAGPDMPDTQPNCLPVDQVIYGMNRTANVIRPACWPRWMDKAKFAKGQQFQRDNYGAITLAQMFSIVSGFFFDETTDLLLFTSTNDCEADFVKNYGSLFRNMKLWGEAKIDDQTQQCSLLQSLLRSNQVHQKVATRLERVYATNNGTLGNKDRFPDVSTRISKAVWDAFKKDMEAAYTPEQLTMNANYLAQRNSKTRVPFSQFQLGTAVVTFSGASTLSKVNAMVSCASDDQIEAFNYMWAVAGHIVGIDDAYNGALQPNFAAQEKYYNDLLYKYQIPAAYNMSDYGKFFAESAVQKFLSAPLYINKVNIPNPVPIDGWLMSICSSVLGIPYDNLLKVASPQGIVLVNAITGVQDLMAETAVLNLGNISACAVAEDLLTTAVGKVIDATALKAYGAAYATATTCDIATSIHYEYVGPDINPDGKNWNYTCPIIIPN